MNRPGDDAGLSDGDLETLTAVLDCLIPPSADGALPGAGALGLARYVVERFGEAAPALASGLEALDTRAQQAGGARFAGLAPDLQPQVLAAHGDADAGFLPGLLFHTYAGYYQQPEVQEAHGMEGRPPHPKGYAMETDGDPTLLDPVRARGPLYREP